MIFCVLWLYYDEFKPQIHSVDLLVQPVWFKKLLDLCVLCIHGLGTSLTHRNVEDHSY